MSFWDRIGEAVGYLQKPAGAYAGLMGGLYKALGGDQLDPENQLGYDDPLEGLIHGWRNSDSMYKTMNKLYGDYKEPGVAESLFGGISDIGYDPLILTGPMGGSSSILKDVPVIGKIAEGAGTAGKVGDLGALGKAGQYGRRYLTGLRLTGDPISAIPVAGVQGAIEHGVTGLAKSKALTNILARGGSKVAEDVLEEGVDAAGNVVAKTPTDSAAQVEDALQATAKTKAPKGRATTAKESMETLTGVKNPTTLDLARSVLPASTRAAPEVAMTPGQQMISDMIEKRSKGGVPLADIEAADAGVIARAEAKKPRPVVKAPKANTPNPNIAAGLGKPGGPQDLYRESIGPQLSESDMPGFLRRGAPATPQEAAIQKIVESKVAADFDDWRRAAIGPFTPTAASEGAMTPERLAYFMQNYGQ